MAPLAAPSTTAGSPTAQMATPSATWQPIAILSALEEMFGLIEKYTRHDGPDATRLTELCEGLYIAAETSRDAYRAFCVNHQQEAGRLAAIIRNDWNAPILEGPALEAVVMAIFPGTLTADQRAANQALADAISPFVQHVPDKPVVNVAALDFGAADGSQGRMMI